MLTTFPFQIQNSWQLSLLELPPCCVPTRNIVTSSSDFSNLYTSTVQSGSPSVNTSFPPHPHLQTSYPPFTHLLPLPPHHCLFLLAVVLRLLLPLPPDSLRVVQWNAGGFRARNTELLPFLSSHPIDLICTQESNLNLSFSFRILGFSFRSDCTHSRSGILFCDITHASGGVIIFVRQGLSFSELSTSSLSSLDLYSDYVGVNISLNNFSSLSFFNVYASFIRSSLSDGKTDSFSFSILPSSRNLFILGDFNCHHPLWDSRGTSDPRGVKAFDWVISSDLLPFNDPDISTFLHRFSPDIFFASFSLALSCSWEVLQDMGSVHLLILLSVPLSPVFRPNECPPSFNFQKACWDDFAFYFDSHCPSAEEYSFLSLSSAAAALFTSLALNAAKSSIPFGCIKRPPKAWWSAEVDGAVSERRKAFVAAHRSNEDRQAYIFTSRRASSVIAKAKAETWQTTCSSLSPKFNPRSVYSLLRSDAGSPSSSSSSTNFPNCSSPSESASVYVAYLRSHFFVSQPKALRSRAIGYLSELRRATYPEESSSLCSPFSPTEFLAATSNLSSSTATGPDKDTYSVLKHLPRSGMDFLLHICNLFWTLHSILSVWKTSSIIPIHKMGKPLNSPASFRPISLTSCVSKLLERIILSRLLFFLISFSLPGWFPPWTVYSRSNSVPFSVHLG